MKHEETTKGKRLTWNLGVKVVIVTQVQTTVAKGGPPI